MPSMLRALTGVLFVLCLLPVRAEPPPPAPSEPAVVDMLHGVGSTAQQAASQLGDIFAFLLWQTGRLGTRH